jgi:hypothetical protein
VIKFLCGLVIGAVGALIYEGWKTLGDFESSAEAQ